MTNENYAYLSQFDHQFHTAVESNYCRNVGTEVLKRMKQIYLEETGINYTINLGCNHCIMDFMQKLGRQYLNEKEKRAVQKELELTPIEKARMAKQNKKATNK